MSRPDPHIIGLCPSTSYLLQMYIKSRMNKRPEKKTTVFTKKICKFKTSYYLCNTKFQRWIHLRVRIRASHARHRGSNPLSTTKSDCNSRSFYYCLSGVTGQGKFGQTEQRGPYELRSSRRVVTLSLIHISEPPTKEKTILAVLRPHSLSKIHRNQKQPGIRTAKIINSKLPACTGNISVRTAIFAGGLEIIHFSYAHRFGHCPKLLSCTLSRTAYRKYSATDVSGFRTDSARRLFDRRQP